MPIPVTTVSSGTCVPPDWNVSGPITASPWVAVSSTEESLIQLVFPAGTVVRGLES